MTATDELPFEVASWRGRWRYRVDDAGIASTRSDGSARRFIAWDRLDRVGYDSIRSTDGDRMAIRLLNPEKSRLIRSILIGWRSRQPDAFARDRARDRSNCRRTLRYYLPGLMVSALLLNFALKTWFGCWPSVAFSVAWLERSTATVGVFSAGLWILEAFAIDRLIDPGRVQPPAGPPS